MKGGNYPAFPVSNITNQNFTQEEDQLPNQRVQRRHEAFLMLYFESGELVLC
jgi:hypothetical protein